MVAASGRQRPAATRRSQFGRLAPTLWIVLVVIVWNFVFDHVIIAAGRQYLSAAVSAAARGGPYLPMHDAMRPAIHRAVIDASLAAAATLAAGLPVILRLRRSGRTMPR
ncbi:MAG: hypothetical protein ACM3SQ_03910 [Betaproteobacteria bacterium]